MNSKLITKNSLYRGFTLTEVVVASALLIVGVVPILKALTTAHVNTTIIEHRSYSLILAQSKLDQIKARSIYNYGSSFAQTSSSIGGSYLCSVVDSQISANLRKITVSVGYDRDSNNNLTQDEIDVSLATLIARRW
jgi:Tfp pilus assembly protein PilV